MSKRVSIVLPDGAIAKQGSRTKPSSRRELERQILMRQYQAPGIINNGNAIRDSTPQSSTEDGNSLPRRIAKHPRKNKNNKEQDETNSQRVHSQSSSTNVVISSLTPTFTFVSTDEPTTMQSSVIEDNNPPNTPYDFQPYDKNCDCCHCQHVKLAMKQAAFLETPEGQHRQEMKYLAKNFFMDICAMSYLRNQIRSELYGTKQDHPSSRISFPVSLKGAHILDSNSLIVTWFIHDQSDIDYYIIFVDNKLAKRVYNVQSTNTILIDMDPHTMHKLRMKAVPYKGRGSKADPMDKLVEEVCAGKMKNVMKGDFFCNCNNITKATKSFYKKNKCKSLIDFWTDSEFLYIPSDRCVGTSDCECFMDNCGVSGQHAQPSECM